MIKRIYTILSFCCLSVIAKGQDVSFSQFYEQPLLRNPALAGVFTGDLRVSTIYRNQWQSISVPFRTGFMSIEKKIISPYSNSSATIGLQAGMDAAGDIALKRSYILPAFNYSKSLSDEKDEFLSLGIMAGRVNSQFDPTQLKLGDQWRGGGFSSSNPSSQVIENTGYNYWDAAVGISYSSIIKETTRFYIGGALFHFTQPKINVNNGNSEATLNQKLVFNLGINHSFNERNRIVGFADYFKQGENKQLLFGAMYAGDVITADEYSKSLTIQMGCFMRWGDAIIPMLKIDHQNLSVGLTYDVNISSLNIASNWRGGFEMSMVYKGFLKIPNSARDKMRCPKF